MPQFIAVQCFRCHHFQVSQTRNDSKFNCKLCGAKQSVRKILARSHRASDVRNFIQPLNLARGRAERQFHDQNLNNQSSLSPHNLNHSHHCEHPADTQPSDRVPPVHSRWQPYTATTSKEFTTIASHAPIHSQSEEEKEEEDDDDIVTVLPDFQTKPRGRKRSTRSRASSTHAKRHAGEDSCEMQSRCRSDESHARFDRKGENTHHLKFQGQVVHTQMKTSPLPFTSVYQQSNESPVSPRGTSSHYAERATLCAAQQPGFDSGGLLTSMTGDEVVHDEIMY